MNKKITPEELKKNTKIGDQYRVYYHGIDKTDKVKTITRFNEKSIWWDGKNRESWNTVSKTINKQVYRKI